MLDGMYDGVNKVWEQLSGGQVGSDYIYLPDRILSNAIKGDESSIGAETTQHYVMTQQQRDAWVNKVPYEGHDNVFSLRGLNFDNRIEQKLWVLGHPITPDYNRLQEARPVETTPVTVTEQPK